MHYSADREICWQNTPLQWVFQKVHTYLLYHCTRFRSCDEIRLQVSTIRLIDDLKTLTYIEPTGQNCEVLQRYTINVSSGRENTPQDFQKESRKC